MRKTLIVTAAALGLLASMPADAQVRPLPLASGDQPAVTLVSGGCGPAFHRGPFGGCRPNFYGGGYGGYGWRGYGWRGYGWRRGWHRW